MTSPQIIAVMALMREIEKPTACYNRAVRRASQTLTDSPENDAAQTRGNAALLEIEKAVRAWVAKHPDPEQARRVLGTTEQADTVAAPAEAEAHRPLTEWIAEVREYDGRWEYLGADPDRTVAEKRCASVTRRHPDAPTRIVRKTTTYTVAAEAQQPTPAPAEEAK